MAWLLRVSAGPYTTTAETDRLVEALGGSARIGDARERGKRDDQGRSMASPASIASVALEPAPRVRFVLAAGAAIAVMSTIAVVFWLRRRRRRRVTRGR